MSQISGEAFRQLVVQKLAPGNEVNSDRVEGDHFLNPDYQSKVVAQAVKPAAILMPVVERETGLNLVFTKRTQKLKSHSGQVSFPGGRIDRDDASPVMAALRETHEEIGVEEDKVEVLGQLPDYYTGSGYHISCVVGMVDGAVAFTPNPDEVDTIFEVPLSFLMEPDNHGIGSRVFENNERFFYEMPWQEYYIWGVTAGIVRMFYNRVYS